MKTDLRENRNYFSNEIINSKTKQRTADFFETKTKNSNVKNFGKYVDDTPEYDYTEINKWLKEIHDEITGTYQYRKASNTSTSSISPDLDQLLNMFKDAGINVKVTSGYREGAVTSNGKPSFHASGEAIDIVPEDGNFDALAFAIKNNPEISAFMKQKGYGIIDETSQEMLQRTGGTGKHFHVGKDQLAQQFWI